MTTTLSNSDRVGEIAARRPAAARVFERLGIDYCCAGSRTLDDACARKSLDAAVVLAAIEASSGDATQGRDWSAATMTELCDHIESTHHAYTKSEMPRLSEIIAKVVRAHGERRSELAEVARQFTRLQGDMMDHMAKEEQVLFPALRRVDAGAGVPWAAHGPIQCLTREHDEAGAILAAIRTLTSDYQPPLGACATYRVMLASLAEFESDLHQHVHKENNILFPMILRAPRTEP